QPASLLAHPDLAADPLLRSAPLRRRLGRQGARLGRRLERQPDGEARSLAFLAVDGDTAAVQIDHHLHEVEADAGADNPRHVAAAEVAFEQAALVGGRNADALILNRYDEAAVLRPRGDPDAAAAGRILDRVGEEIVEHLGQQLGIADHAQAAVAQL